jgi:hypothetical protein
VYAKLATRALPAKGGVLHTMKDKERGMVSPISQLGQKLTTRLYESN